MSKPRVRRSAKLLWTVTAAVGAFVLPLHLHCARSAEPSTVTIEAQQRKKKELKYQISHFVGSVAVSYLNESLQRWNTPVCPLVAGMPREHGEFILTRVSQIATASHVPLAGEHCKANFYVVVSPDPDQLVKKWWDRDRNLLNFCVRQSTGMGTVKEFLHSRRPVRVWYNAGFRSNEAQVEPSEGVVQPDLGMLTVNGCTTNGGVTGTRLRYSAVQALSSVIVIVDSRDMANVNIGQLADYVAMVGFAQVRTDSDTGTAPTILSLFRPVSPPPQGLSTWDQSFLYALYTSDQASTLHVSAIKSGMFERIEQAPGSP